MKEYCQKRKRAFEQARDNIHVLQHVVDKELAGRGKEYAFFVELKGTFPSVDRGILWEVIE